MEKILIKENTGEYRSALHRAGEKVKAFREVIGEASKLLPVPTDSNFKTFFENPVQYVKDELDKANRGTISKGISTNKLMELLEFDLNPLENAVKRYSAMRGAIKWDGKELKPDVDIENFRQYITTKEQIEFYNKGQALIKAFYDFMGKETNLHTLHSMMEATNDRLKNASGIGLYVCPYRAVQAF